MRGTQIEFRLRVLIIFLLYFLGFWAPWERLTSASRVQPLWSWLAITLAHLGWLKTETAFVVVTLAAILLASLGAFYRIWGTAYLGHSVVRDADLHGTQVVAAGPFRYIRNPLYLGNWLTGVAVSILMPPTGALFFVFGLTLFQQRLIGAEEAHLAALQGEAYAEYRRLTPRFLPRLRTRLPYSAAHAAWAQAFLSESYGLAIAICFAVLAWRYDAMLLTRCVLVCFGASLLIQAIMPRTAAS